MLSGFFERIVGIYKDIINYFYLITRVNKNKKTSIWKDELLLRHDWIYRIYTVINLRPEDFGDDEYIKNIRLNERLDRYYDYLVTLNLHEVTTVDVEYIEGTYSYLFKVKPLFRYLTLSWILKTTTSILAFFIIVYYIDAFFDLRFIFDNFIKYLKEVNILK